MGNTNESKEIKEVSQENFDKQIALMITLLQSAKMGENQVILAFKEGKENQIHMMGDIQFAFSVASALITKMHP